MAYNENEALIALGMALDANPKSISKEARQILGQVEKNVGNLVVDVDIKKVSDGFKEINKLAKETLKDVDLTKQFNSIFEVFGDATKNVEDYIKVLNDVKKEMTDLSSIGSKNGKSNKDVLKMLPHLNQRQISKALKDQEKINTLREKGIDSVAKAQQKADNADLISKKKLRQQYAENDKYLKSINENTVSNLISKMGIQNPTNEIKNEVREYTELVTLFEILKEKKESYGKIETEKDGIENIKIAKTLLSLYEQIETKRKMFSSNPKYKIEDTTIGLPSNYSEITRYDIFGAINSYVELARKASEEVIIKAENELQKYILEKATEQRNKNNAEYEKSVSKIQNKINSRSETVSSGTSSSIDDLSKSAILVTNNIKELEETLTDTSSDNNIDLWAKSAESLKDEFSDVIKYAVDAETALSEINKIWNDGAISDKYLPDFMGYGQRLLALGEDHLITDDVQELMDIEYDEHVQKYDKMSDRIYDMTEKQLSEMERLKSIQIYPDENISSSISEVQKTVNEAVEVIEDLGDAEKEVGKEGENFVKTSEDISELLQRVETLELSLSEMKDELNSLNGEAFEKMKTDISDVKKELDETIEKLKELNTSSSKTIEDDLKEHGMSSDGINKLEQLYSDRVTIDKNEKVDSVKKTESGIIEESKIEDLNKDLKNQSDLYKTIYERIEKIRMLGMVGANKNDLKDIRDSYRGESRNIKAYRMQVEGIKKLSPTGEMNPDIRDLVLNPKYTIEEVSKKLLECAEIYVSCKNALDNMFEKAGIIGGNVYNDAYRSLSMYSADPEEMFGVIGITRDKLALMKAENIARDEAKKTEVQEKIQAEILETEKYIDREKKSLKHLGNLINGEINFAGKKDATDSLKHLHRTLIDQENKNGRYNDQTVVAYNNVYNAAKKLGVAQSTLDKYFNPIAINNYNKSLVLVKGSYDVTLQSIDLFIKKVQELNSQLTSSQIVTEVHQSPIPDSSDVIDTNNDIIKSNEEVITSEKKKLKYKIHSSAKGPRLSTSENVYFEDSSGQLALFEGIEEQQKDVKHTVEQTNDAIDGLSEQQKDVEQSVNQSNEALESQIDIYQYLSSLPALKRIKIQLDEIFSSANSVSKIMESIKTGKEFEIDLNFKEIDKLKPLLKKFGYEIKDATENSDDLTFSGKIKSKDEINRIREVEKAYTSLTNKLDDYYKLISKQHKEPLDSNEEIKLKYLSSEIEKAVNGIGEYENAVDEAITAQDNFNKRLKEYAESSGESIYKKFANSLNIAKNNASSKSSGFSQKISEIEIELSKLKGILPIDFTDEDSVKNLKDAEVQIEKLFKEINSKDFDIVSSAKSDSLITKISRELSKNSAAPTELKSGLKMLRDEVERLASTTNELDNITFDKLNAQFIKLQKQIEKSGKTGLSMFDKIGKKIRDLVAYFATYVSIQDLMQVAREGFEIMRTYDKNLTEMNKVSKEHISTLKSFQKESFSLADSIGTTASAVQSSTADWMRLGESLEEAKRSAQDATILYNVSEFETIDEATESLVSMSQAFKDLSKGEIIDVVNNLGNNFAISTDGLATALKDSASSLQTAKNDFFESAALATAANTVVQDPAKVGAGLRTIALRITGTESARKELEELGEDISDFQVTTTSKMNQQIIDLTKTQDSFGVSLLDMNGNYRSTYDILLDIAKVWDQIKQEDLKTGENRQNALLELMANFSLYVQKCA